jgi:hypothetical protein
MLTGALANVLLLTPLPPLVQAIAALWIAGFLPGALLVEALVGQSASRPDRFERVLYSTAAAYAIMVVGMLLISYLPGGPAQLPTLLAFDAVALIAGGWVGWRDRRVQPGAPAWEPFAGDRRWFWAGLLALLTAGAIFRFVGLEYADYQGDEARAALRAAAVLQGYEDVLMLHKKGPTEILIPTVLYTLTGHLTEQTARLPFAIANLAALLASFVLGWRLFRPLAGWLAAMFLLLDGYFIGFAHIVQYQSVVFLTSVLAVLLLYRLYVKPAATARYLSLAAILLATGMLSHYEGALAAIPAAYLLGVIFWRNRDQWRALLGATALRRRWARGAGSLLRALHRQRSFCRHLHLSHRPAHRRQPALQQPQRRFSAHDALQHHLLRAAADCADRVGCDPRHPPALSPRAELDAGRARRARLRRDALSPRLVDHR